MKHVDFLSANEIFDTSIVIMIILFALEYSRTRQYSRIKKKLMLTFCVKKKTNANIRNSY